MNLRIWLLSLATVLGASALAGHASAYTNPFRGYSYDTLLDGKSLDSRLGTGWFRYLFRGQKVTSGCDWFNVHLASSDGNLVVDRADGQTLWAAGSNGAFYSVLAGSDGQFGTYTSAGSPIWVARTSGRGVDRLIMARDGNLVLNNVNTTIWASGTGGTRPATPCSWSHSESTYVKSNWMLNGDWYANTTETRDTDCANKCVQDRTCVAFSYYTNNRNCYLRHGLNYPTGSYAETGVTSGFIRGRAGYQEPESSKDVGTTPG